MFNWIHAAAIIINLAAEVARNGRAGTRRAWENGRRAVADINGLING